MSRAKQELLREIEAVAGVEYHVETNQGTYGGTEAVRKVGTADPQFANREVYETADGVRRVTGPDEVHAPGRMRKINRQALADAKAHLARLRKMLQNMECE